MIQATVGFIVYGVHKDGLRDPMGSPFIDEALIIEAKTELRKAGLQSSIGRVATGDQHAHGGALVVVHVSQRIHLRAGIEKETGNFQCVGWSLLLNALDTIGRDVMKQRGVMPPG